VGVTPIVRPDDTTTVGASEHRNWPCPICEGDTRILLASLYDDRYGYPGRFAVRACRHCGHRHLAASFAPDELGRLYSNFYPRGNFDLESFHPYTETVGFDAWLSGELASAFRSVPRNVRVLDIGCGFGETLAYHQARGCEAYGVEADENILRVGDRFGLNVRAGLFDPAEYDSDSFDYVTLDQVLEHVADPRQFMKGVAAVLKPGGVAIVSTPNALSYGARLLGRRWINWHVPYHLQHFSQTSLKTLAATSGFRVESIATVTNSRWLHYQFLHLFSAPPMGTASPFWDPDRSSGSISVAALRTGRGLQRVRVFDVVTRIADACWVGDNLLCFMQKPQ
jgi:2-polyprenyl-3-methyl-5-hydroxy-6-metoxy-1,4-benzoquinol methylase